MKSLLFGLIVGCSLIGSCGVYISFGKEPSKDYDTAIQSARQEQKNVLVIFSLDNCHYCDVLKKDLFNIKETENYIVCVLDSRLNKKLTGKMNVKKWPTSIIMTVGKEVQGEVSRFVGYGDKKEYQRWLIANAAFFGSEKDGVCGCDCAEDCSCRKDGICTCCGDKCDCCECGCDKSCECKKNGKCSCKKNGKCKCKK